MDLPVLVEQRVWPEFIHAVESLGDDWIAPTGRRYELTLSGHRFEVALALGDLEPPPSADGVDEDLLELACLIYDRVGGDWSTEALRNIARLWGWEV